MVRRKGLGAVVGRSDDRSGSESMRDTVLNADAETQIEAPPEKVDLPEPEPEPETSSKPETSSEPQKPKRNHSIPIDYFRGLDVILAESYSKQKATHQVIEAFTRMMEARGIPGTFEEERFEREATNLATVAMMRQMCWLFGLGPEYTDRIMENTIDKLFGAKK
jgi:hypothetical protein